MIYAFDDYELDTLAMELRLGGDVVHVEPQVFGVLAHLIANRDRVVSKIELLDEVWPDRFVSESAITSRLQAARKACGDTGRDQRVIRTKHGRGYRFVAHVVERNSRADPDPATGARPDDPALVEPLHEGGIIGRESELEILDRAILRSRRGQGRMIFVTGEAGIGKSALVETATERIATEAGNTILEARCRPHRGRPEPYVSLLEAISRFGRDNQARTRAALEDVAPMWLMQIPSLLDPARSEALGVRVLGGTRERMMREGVDLLERLAEPGPLTLVVEDLHWADAPTLELLEWLADRIEGSPLLVLATYRPSEDQDGGLDATVARLEMDRLADRLRLLPFDDRLIERLIADRLNATSVVEELVTSTMARTGGNPLFVNEQIDAWSDDGTLRVLDGTVTLERDPSELSRDVPEGIRFLVEAALGRIEESDVTLLEAGAVVGREFPAFVVAAALGRPVPEVEDELGALARRGAFIAATGDQTWSDGTVSTVFRISHDIHHRTLYDRISASRRATMHQIVGERFELAHGRHTDAHVMTLLGHFEAAGDVARMVTYLQRAGELAIARSAHREAVHPLEAGLALLDRLPDDDARDRREMEMRTTLSSALVATSGWGDPGIQLNYERALELATRLDATPERFIARYGLAGVHELRGEYNRSDELMSEQVADGSELAVETHDLLACSTFHQGAHSRSLDSAAAGIAAWDPETHSAYMARYGEHPGVSCNTWGALSAWYLGRPSLSMEMAQQALEWGMDNEYALTMARVQLAFLHQFRDEPERCRFWAEQTVELARAQGIPFRAAQAEILLGWCRAVRGDAAEGVDQIRSALEAYRATGARIDEPYHLGLLADAELAAGRPAEALAHLDEAEATIRATTRSFFYEPELDRIRALTVLALNGDSARPEAADLVSRAASTASERGSVALELRALVTALELELGDDLEARRDDLNRLLAACDDGSEFPDRRRALALLS